MSQHEQKLLANSTVQPDGCRIWHGTLYSNGYGYVRYYDPETGDAYPDCTHRAAFKTWIGPIPEGAYVLHACDKRACIEPSHLYLGTHADNMADLRARGGYVGARNNNAALTTAQVKDIRRQYKGRKGPTQQQLADMYHVSRKTIVRIINGYTYAEPLSVPATALVVRGSRRDDHFAA